MFFIQPDKRTERRQRRWMEVKIKEGGMEVKKKGGAGGVRGIQRERDGVRGAVMKKADVTSMTQPIREQQGGRAGRREERRQSSEGCVLCTTAASVQKRKGTTPWTGRRRLKRDTKKRQSVNRRRERERIKGSGDGERWDTCRGKVETIASTTLCVCVCYWAGGAAMSYIIERQI